MELEDCKNNFEYDGIPFDVHLPTTQYVMHAMYWKPEDEKSVNACLIYVHGMSSLLVSERDTATLMNENNIAFFACDHIGHGRSEGPIMSCTVEEIIGETLEVAKKCNEAFPGKPVFVMGHSLGGLTSIYMGMFKTDDAKKLNIKGIIAMAPYLSDGELHPISTIEGFILRAGNKLVPTMKIPVGGGFEEGVEPVYAEKMLKMSTGVGYVTARMIVSCMDAIPEVRVHAEQWPDDLPLLFFQGKKDAATNGLVNIAWAEKVKECHPDAIEIVTFDEATHQLPRIACRGEIMRKTLSFIESHQ